MNKLSGILGVMIAKKNSTRLPNKNRLNFKGVPLFQWNLKKLIKIFNHVVFDSDCTKMLDEAQKLGADPHLRSSELRGNDVPSVPIFLSIINDFPSYSHIINVQANSPNVSEQVIYNSGAIAKKLSINEILTMYSDHSINGSVWGISKKRLENYGDFYIHSPDVLLLDDSVDVHTIDEFNRAIEYNEN